MPSFFRGSDRAERTGWRSVGAAAFFALATGIYFVGGFEPFRVRFPRVGLDPSWAAVVAEAAARGWQWGPDLAFTYGPASTLVTHYFTPAYGFVIGTALVLSLVFGALFTITVQASPRLGRAVWLVPVVLAGILATSGDSFYFSLAFLVFALSFSIPPGSRAIRVLLGAAAFGIGVAGMAKMSIGVLGILLFATADAKELLERRFPFLTVCLLAGAAATYLLTGQNLHNLPEFLRLQGEVIAGYPAAMTYKGSWREVIWFCAACVTFLGLVLALEQPHSRNAGSRIRLLLFFAGLGAFELLCTKAGFVRQDAHTNIAWSAIGMAALYLALLHPTGPVPARAALVALGAILLFAVAPFSAVGMAKGARLERVMARQRDALLMDPLKQIQSAGAFLVDPSGWLIKAAAQKSVAEAKIRSLVPLPNLVGSVDMIVSQQSAVLAHGLDYRPRPSFQDYSTYTVGLNEANRSFFASDRAPDWVIFGLSPIDNRHPALAEGASWPELLRRYKPESASPGLVFLRRRSQALPDVLGAPSGFTARLGVDFSLPPRQPSFVRLKLRQTVAGRLASAAYRPGQLAIVSTLDDGTVQIYRLIAGSAEEGFVVSPLISTAEEFNDLASSQLDHAHFVSSVRIEAERPWEFHDELAVEVRPLLVQN